MIIGIISDVHGNLQALDVALADARSHGAERFIGVGDWVGYGPFPGQVIDRLQLEEHMTCIRGNYDTKAVNARTNPGYYADRLKPGKWEILNWTQNQLTDHHIKWLKDLPDSRKLEPVTGFRIHVYHGSPEGNEGRIYPSITSQGLRSMSRESFPDIMIVGHTHIPFVKTVDGCMIINVGSTGQPVDGDPRPMFALLKVEKDTLPEAKIVRFNYPVDTLVAALKRTELPQWLVRDFLTGKKRK